ncbi:MAG: hypothetical protein QUT27_08305, partial [candidate division Zixibacteria bacterium]|nr:hypothetical protein [candidate division Zixibacteria bacterium]
DTVAGITCMDTSGSYTCSCGTYYQASGGTCVDIDECAVMNGGCGTGFTCANNVGAAPTCTAISCGAAPSVTNAGSPSISGGAGGGSTTTYGATAAYTCNTGYTKSGMDSVCQLNGTWTAAPTCTVISCGTPPAVTNAAAPAVSGGVGGGSTTTYGATATYTCSSGYLLQSGSPNTRTCGTGGTWTSNTITCIPSSCTLVYDFAMPSSTSAALRIQPGIAGNTTVNIGPGKMIVRVPNNNTRTPTTGTAEILYYDMDLYFASSGVTTQTRNCLLQPGMAAPAIPATAEPPEQVNVSQCLRETNTTAMATGTFNYVNGGTGSFAFECYEPEPTSTGYTPAMATGTSPGCLRTWFSYGRVWCQSGQTCSLALPTNQWLDRTSAWSQHMETSASPGTVALASNLSTLTLGNRGGGSTTSAWVHVPNDDTGWTGFALQGTLNTGASTCNVSALP